MGRKTAKLGKMGKESKRENNPKKGKTRKKPKEERGGRGTGRRREKGRNVEPAKESKRGKLPQIGGNGPKAAAGEGRGGRGESCVTAAPRDVTT